MRSKTIAAALACACAASGAAAQGGRFLVSANGHEVVDTQARLVWKRCPEGMLPQGHECRGSASKFSLAAARRHAAAGWRMPTQAELSGIVIKTDRKPLLDTAAFPGTPAEVFWALRPGYSDDLNASLVDFGNGKVYGSAGSKHYLRLVRDP